MVDRLRGRSVLVIEHEPLIARELEEQLKRAGARVFAASKLRDALHLANHPALAAAVINQRLGNEKTTAVCRRLEYLGIPFVFYTRYDPAEVAGKWPAAPVIAKPAGGQVVARTLAALLH
jgi:DNA-binding response OmpR family regulator